MFIKLADLSKDGFKCDAEGKLIPAVKTLDTYITAIPGGWLYADGKGNTYTTTYNYNNTNPTSPTLEITVDGVMVTSIPLYSYDVNIETTGGFIFDPLTDTITITETDGETHTINLKPFRVNIVSSDNSTTVIPILNPDGSMTYDLHNKVNTLETSSIPYTGVELPTTPGVNIGDTTTMQFGNGVTASYTWDGLNWITAFTEDLCFLAKGLVNGNPTLPHERIIYQDNCFKKIDFAEYYFGFFNNLKVLPALGTMIGWTGASVFTLSKGGITNDPTTGIFTVPTPGLYTVTLNVVISNDTLANSASVGVNQLYFTVVTGVSTVSGSADFMSRYQNINFPATRIYDSRSYLFSYEGIVNTSAELTILLKNFSDQPMNFHWAAINITKKSEL